LFVVDALITAPAKASGCVLAAHSEAIFYGFLAAVAKRPLRVDGVCRAQFKKKRRLACLKKKNLVVAFWLAAVSPAAFSLHAVAILPVFMMKVQI